MNMLQLDNVPSQPDESDWKFIDDLCAPLHQPICWDRSHPRKTEVNLASGVKLNIKFPDSQGLLETAYQDIRDFFEAGNIPLSDSGYPITIDKQPLQEKESYELEVRENGCEINAGDTEGIRRGIIYLQDMILRSCGPFLPLGKIQRKPWLKTRISRCFFGPIKRAPKHRDELMDDVDYYPDEYLNRLAHDAVNGLWLTVSFKDLQLGVSTAQPPRTSSGCASSDPGRSSREKRLEKLRKTVKKCARYGIKIYLFCIEPAAFPIDSEVLKAHPELGGNKQSQWTTFCISSEEGRQFLEKATESIFAAVPGLGGLINICVGERPTHCYSLSHKNSTCNCPRCSKRTADEVLFDVLAAMEKGMHRAEPNAELIAWPYGQYHNWGEKETVESSLHIPPNVILQHTFETPDKTKQLGKTRDVADYSLIHIGPSPVYAQSAKNAVSKGNRVSAKIQVGCSHEVATVPWVPVPGTLYEKYKAMRELGTSSVMQCWYFGNYPSLMTKAAGELAFESFPVSKQDFLKDLALLTWGKHAPDVAKAWNCFQKGYKQYPLMGKTNHYNPVADGPTWPLYLVPRDIPIAPPWLLGYPPSGDRIGECVSYSHTFDEALTLFSNVVSEWQKGLDIINNLKLSTEKSIEQKQQTEVARALGVQFNSAVNILRFYDYREKLPYAKQQEQLSILKQMQDIVEDEMATASELEALCQQNPALGFHSEAEGYKYFPKLIQWRIKQLEKMLKTEFPVVKKQINDSQQLFPDYTGLQPKGDVYICQETNDNQERIDWNNIPEVTCSFKVNHKTGALSPLSADDLPRYKTIWQAVYDHQFLHLMFNCYDPDPGNVKDFFKDRNMQPFWGNDVVGIRIEPKRLWTPMLFVANPKGARYQEIWGAKQPYSWQAEASKKADRWTATMRIPLKLINRDNRDKLPIRLDIFRMITLADPSQGEILHTWAEQNPIKSRCGLRNNNPDDLKWMIFK